MKLLAFILLYGLLTAALWCVGFLPLKPNRADNVSYGEGPTDGGHHG